MDAKGRLVCYAKGQTNASLIEEMGASTFDIEESVYLYQLFMLKGFWFVELYQ